MRELTPEETSRILTQEQVDALPEGTPIIVKWSGGNGPHRYVIKRIDGVSGTFAALTNESYTPADSKLFPVGTERHHDRVFLPE